MRWNVWTKGIQGDLRRLGKKTLRKDFKAKKKLNTKLNAMIL